MKSTARFVSLAAATTAMAFMAALPARSAHATDATSPIGLWKTFDDKTGAARAIVRIYEQDGKLFGKIVSSLTPGADERVCIACEDERKNQPIIGLVIVRNMQRVDDGYRGGDILDPENGSVYRCRFHVEDGVRLVVRGYIGISLLGRTQTWQRQQDDTPAPIVR